MVTRSPFTIKGLVVGSLFSLFIGVAAPYGSIVIRGSWWGLNASAPGAIFLFFIFTFLINMLIGIIRRPFALGRGDLVLVYSMLLMALTVPTQNFLVYIIPTICVPYYSASVENDWATLIHPYIPEWIAPQDFDVIKHLYEGLPAGQAIPWASLDRPARRLVFPLRRAQSHDDLHVRHPPPAVVGQRTSGLPDDSAAAADDRGG